MSKGIEPRIEVTGGYRLSGEIALPGAKNAALPAIAAACLGEAPTILRNVPLRLNDVQILLTLLREMGASIRTVAANTIECNGSSWIGGAADPASVEQLRHALFLLGGSAYWKRDVHLPATGGCALGSRKHDLHAEVLRALGHGIVDAADGLRFTWAESPDFQRTIRFRYPSFGATLNAMFAALSPERGVTVIENPARNPEVADVVSLLQSMGGKLEWKADCLVVRGEGVAGGADYRVMSDRIVAATLIGAIAITRGKARLLGGDARYLTSEIETWRRCGVDIKQTAARA